MSVEAGAALFKSRCELCHTADKGGGNKTGPNLFGIVGRKSGSVEGFPYTASNKNSGVVWTEDNLFTYLENPKKFIKGTNMVFAGMKKEANRRDIIAFLKTKA